MNTVDSDARPFKKRRFFQEEDDDASSSSSEEAPPLPGSTLDEHKGSPGKPHKDGDKETDKALPSEDTAGHFDVTLLEAFVGQSLSEDVVRKLQDLSGGNVERAVNMYLDDSWKDNQGASSGSARPQGIVQSPLAAAAPTSSIAGTFPPALLKESSTRDLPRTPIERAQRFTRRPDMRYVGAFGVAGWATRSGVKLAHGEEVRIERTKLKPTTKLGRGGKVVQVRKPNQKDDIIVRFTNQHGEEVGRFPKETAGWVAPLVDQKVCRFEGRCVFAPDRVRVNDTIYIQIRCSLLTEAFESGAFKKPQDNNRTTGLYEEKETSEEKELRLRQFALVKLFVEVNLHPISTNELTAKHKRQGLLQAAEAAEQYDLQPNGGSSPDPDEEAEDGQELEQDQLDTLYKKAQSFDFNTPEAEPAKTFNLTLRKYQRQALHWMMGKEKNETSEEKQASMHPLWEEYRWPVKDMEDNDLPVIDGQEAFYVNPYSGELGNDFPVQEQNCLGGILADEMGLGKTIEMLSLIHTHRPDYPALSADGVSSVNNLPRLPANPTKVEPAPQTTLVVGPMSLLAQWESEAVKASVPGSLKTMVYYGSDKAANLRHLCCAANAASAPNLIITSYGVVLSEFNQIATSGGNRFTHGGLFSLEFFRVILDEAHHVKNRQAKTAKACYEINARHRWVLTGTPIVNRLEDLFSLVRFLRVEPWSNFSFWKTFITTPFESKDFIRALDVVQTVLEPLVLRRTKDMKTPDGEALVPLPPRTIEIEELAFSKAEREVYDYIFMRAKRTFNATVEAGTLMKSYTTIFAQLLRLRQSCCHPVLTRNSAVAAEEDEAAAASDVANGLADDMDLKELIARFESEESEEDANKFGAHVLKQIQDEESNECPICSEEPMVAPAVTGCWHSACKQCLLDYIDHQKDKGELPRCFNCREPINSRDVFEILHEDVVSEADEEEEEDRYEGSEPRTKPTGRISLRRVGALGSAKISALITHLITLRRADSSAKSVVFSQFTGFLDLIEPALTKARIPFLRFDGSMNQKARAAVLEKFADLDPRSNAKKEKSTGYVLLLSLRAGGVGLNLTAANRVFMMDPWWSYAVEAQAIDRVHRMGQDSEVKVIRFVVQGSIEQRMLLIQEKKKFLASSLGMMGEEEKRAERIEDIKMLLS